MKELSVFIDESGDFGEARKRPAYYLVTFVFHDQNDNIDTQVKKLENSIKDAGFDIEYIHTGPVIRRESVFSGYSIDEAVDKVSLSGKLAREIKTVINEHFDYFMNFNKVIVYYDYGQSELSAILNAVFSVQFSNVEFRRAEPQKYRLLQAADFICSMDLLRIKKCENRLSRSEKQFFYRSQELKKSFFKSIDKKKLQ